MEEDKIVTGNISLKAFKHKGFTHSAGLIEDTISLEIPNYDSSIYREWRIKDLLNSPFKPLSLWLYFSDVSALDSFIIKLSIFKNDKILAQFQADYANSKRCGNCAVFDFPPFVIPSNAIIRIGANINIDNILLQGILAFQQPAFIAGDAGTNDDTYLSPPYLFGNFYSYQSTLAPIAGYSISFSDNARNGALGSITVNQDTIYLAPLKIFRIYQYPFIGAFCSGTSSIGKFRFLLYDSAASGLPNKIIYRSGEIDTSSIGNKYAIFEEYLFPNKQYWIGIQSNNVGSFKLDHIKPEDLNSFLYFQNNEINHLRFSHDYNLPLEDYTFDANHFNGSNMPLVYLEA